MEDRKALLEVNDLHVSFFTHAGEVKAVDGISYTLDEGEVIGIVGESGSGKSVEAFAIMGLLQFPGRIVSGSITFDGRDVTTLSKKEYKDFRGKEVSMIFQNPMICLNPVYTIGKQLTEALYNHEQITKQEANERAMNALRLVGINNVEQRMKQYPHELSGGMRQRVMIAMGMICRPRILIADEPTTALDVTIQAQILDLIRDLQKKTGTGVIFITHNLGVVADICHKVAVMYAGSFVEQASVDDIFYNPVHPYTKGLLHSMPKLNATKHERLIPIQGTPVNLLDPPTGCMFSPRCSECMAICREKRPPQKTVGPNHTASCWHLFEDELTDAQKAPAVEVR